ncbi:uncharacterized protein LAESUDRAFT_272597 [Laetiporus sulphureus 93-53]|uniref:Uncharacterized protein n=1 Tax=Laetiporus sulphureus 93-53 TaxID=1314785 RepID=A0A165HAY5_9APHY|nr:uncharacterized protein LAESUDRAFT_272597 [Laetiporus sulphureus 93-53]KZT11484.1 hypothetical protein LAESUDRAFT_272597 [Laetiporus sulphureus 93-53]
MKEYRFIPPHACSVAALRPPRALSQHGRCVLTEGAAKCSLDFHSFDILPRIVVLLLSSLCSILFQAISLALELSCLA